VALTFPAIRRNARFGQVYGAVIALTPPLPTLKVLTVARHRHYRCAINSTRNSIRTDQSETTHWCAPGKGAQSKSSIHAETLPESPAPFKHRASSKSFENCQIAKFIPNLCRTKEK